MSKTAKILEIVECKPWDSQYGKMYKYTLQIDNGDKGSINKKIPDAFKVGDEITYTMEEKISNGNTFYNIKEVKENTFQKKSGSYTRNYKADFISFAMSYAKDLAVVGKIVTTDKDVDIATCEVADTFYKRMCNTYDEINKPTQTQPTTTQPTTYHFNV